MDDNQYYADVLIIGAGLSGLYSLYHIRKKFPEWRVRLIEAGDDVGGVWHWNRYPGCRIDTESLSYSYSFDDELLEEWEWTSTFATQAETLAYIKHVAAKHDLVKDIRFNTRIRDATWEGDSRTWKFVDENGASYRTRFFISCLGFLSAPTLPNIPGVSSFKGKAFHTSRWPQEMDLETSFHGKQVGVIGTGATGIQTITAISKVPGLVSLKVFQRTANWSAPLRNATTVSHIDKQERKQEYATIFEQCSQTPSAFLHKADPRKTLEVTEDERLELWEKIYSEPGFAKWLGVFSDTYTSREANAMYSQFMADKIRSRVHDRITAESLIPNDHGFGTRRVPLESGYFEAFNAENVELIDLKRTPIIEVNASGILTADDLQHDLDILIFATGFDAITGAFNAINWQAKDGRSLIASSESTSKPIWPDHAPRTFLGLTIPAMPNTFMVLGPHQPFGNATRSIEHAVEVIAGMLEHCKENNYTYVEPTLDAVEKWTAHVIDCSQGALVNEVDSWMTGVNKNVAGKTKRSVARYAGSVIEYRKRCQSCKEASYEGLRFA